MVMNKDVISHVGDNRTQYNPISHGCLRCPRMDSFEELCKNIAFGRCVCGRQPMFFYMVQRV